VPARFFRVAALHLVFVLGCALGCAATQAAGALPVATTAATLKVKNEKSFTLALGEHHPPKLAVIDPDDRLIVLVESYVLNSSMTEQAFLALTSLEINTRTLEGVTFNDGEEMVENVFTKPGLYQFILSQGLAVDPQGKHTVTIKVMYE
jgi:hypothetical protein